jgi:hypothetical protein
MMPAERSQPGDTTLVAAGAALPAGMLTFLIADVRGYTAYTHRLGYEAVAEPDPARAR